MLGNNVCNAEPVYLVRWAQPFFDHPSSDRPETGAGHLEELKLVICNVTSNDEPHMTNKCKVLYMADQLSARWNGRHNCILEYQYVCDVCISLRYRYIECIYSVHILVKESTTQKARTSCLLQHYPCIVYYMVVNYRYHRKGSDQDTDSLVLSDRIKV